MTAKILLEWSIRHHASGRHPVQQQQKKARVEPTKSIQRSNHTDLTVVQWTYLAVFHRYSDLRILASNVKSVMRNEWRTWYKWAVFICATMRCNGCNGLKLLTSRISSKNLCASSAFSNAAVIKVVFDLEAKLHYAASRHVSQNLIDMKYQAPCTWQAFCATTKKKRESNPQCPINDLITLIWRSCLAVFHLYSNLEIPVSRTC